MCVEFFSAVVGYRRIDRGNRVNGERTSLESPARQLAYVRMKKISSYCNDGALLLDISRPRSKSFLDLILLQQDDIFVE